MGRSCDYGWRIRRVREMGGFFREGSRTDLLRRSQERLSAYQQVGTRERHAYTGILSDVYGMI